MEGGDFKPLYMPKNSYSKRNEINLAVPPGTNVRFFLTHGGLLKISKNYDVVELTNRVTTELQFTEEFSKEVRTMVMQTITAEAREWNIEDDFGAKPRIETKYAAPEDLEFDETEWEVESSFFKDVCGIDEAYNEAFVKDWRNTNLRHLLRDHDVLMEIKDDLKNVYPQLIDVYKKYSARSIKPDNVFISYTELLDLLVDFDIIDDVFNRSDYDVIFRTLREMEPDTEIKPDAEFVRS